MTAKKSGQWRTSRATDRTTITWSHDEFGELFTYPKRFGLGKTESKEGVFWAPIFLGDKLPKDIEVGFGTNLKEGVRVLYGRHQQIIDCTGHNIPPFIVPINWNEEAIDEDLLPKSRKKDVDNRDVFLGLPNAVWLNKQEAVLTRKEHFYLSDQEIGAYQVLQIPEDLQVPVSTHKVGGKRYALLPLMPEGCFPGADFLRTLGAMGQQLIEYSAKNCEIASVVDFAIPDWDPPAFPIPTEEQKAAGYRGAVVNFFNVIVFGFALCDDGKPCMLPKEAVCDADGEPIMARGGFPVLLGRQPILVKCQEPYKDKKTGRQYGRKALKVLPVD